jgi:hypothetical protein
MFASVELEQNGETVILPARNISLGGVYLEADGHDLGEFAVGDALDVLVFDAVNEGQRPVRLPAQVVRQDDRGMALMWASTDADAALQLATLLSTMQHKGDRR